MWAAVHAPPLVRRRILQVISNDGPGFGRDLTTTRAYQELADRIVTYVPQASLVGTLLHQDPPGQDHPEPRGKHRGPARPLLLGGQGDWLCPPPHRSRRGERESAGFRGWVDSMNPQEREEFTEVFFSLLAASQAETLSELSQGWADSALAVVSAYAALPPEIRRDMLRFIFRLLKNLSRGILGGASGD